MQGGRCTQASIAMTNLSDVPVWSAAAAAALVGTACDDAAIAAAAAAAGADIDPTADNRGPVEFKRHAARSVIRRAIARAASRA
jgi:carbon-monoxide dehydrogenase medium subunit